MIKIIAGLYRRDGGTMFVNGEEVDFKSPADSIARNIKVVYQELDLVPGLSVAENVFLGAYPKTGAGFVDWDDAPQPDARAARRARVCSIDPDRPVGELRVAEQQLVEIARAISRRAQILIMDEPTSALSPAEVDRLFALIEEMQRRNVAIIYVSHKLDEIYRIADRVTVFRDGKRVVTKPVAETTPHDIVTWMVGRELQGSLPEDAAADRPTTARGAERERQWRARPELHRQRRRGGRCLRIDGRRNQHDRPRAVRRKQPYPAA